MEQSERVDLTAVPDFTAIDNPIKIGSAWNSHSIWTDSSWLGNRVIFTDHSTLEVIPEVVEEFFMSSVKYDDDKLAATILFQ